MCSAHPKPSKECFNPRFQSPTAKDAPRSSPKFQHPITHPGSPCSWASLGAIRSLAALKFTQRKKTQTLQIDKGRTRGCHVQEAGDPPQDGVPGCWTLAGWAHPLFHARKWAAHGKAANSGTDLGSLAAVQPCRANLTFFPLPGERGGITQGKHNLGVSPACCWCGGKLCECDQR